MWRSIVVHPFILEVEALGVKFVAKRGASDRILPLFNIAKQFFIRLP
jgi:hypothetical protein